MCLLRYSPQHKSCWPCRLQLAICYSDFSFSCFSIAIFLYSGIYKSVLIYSFCSFLCSFLLSILSILLFFSTLLSAPCSVFSLSNVYLLYFLISLIVFFSKLLSFLFFSLFLLLYSACFSLCSITIQSGLFLLEPSIWYFVAISFAYASFFFLILLFGKDLITLPVLCSYLSLFSLSHYSLSVLFMSPFCFCIYSLFSFICFSCSYCLFLFYILIPSFFIYFYFYFLLFLF